MTSLYQTCTLLSLFLVMLQWHIAGVKCTYFRGGTISWTADNTNNVHFHFRMAWQYGSNGCNGKNTTGSYVTGLSTDKWRCTSGCVGSPDVGDNSYYCIGANPNEDWELGENRLTYILNKTSSKELTVRYRGGSWMSLGYGVGGDWNIETRIDSRGRSDTGTPNNSPVTASLPVYNLSQRCISTLSLPVFDIDDDVTRCRWAVGQECGDSCQNVTSSLPSGTLNQKSCTLTVNPTTSNGYTVGLYYLVALTIEDFPASPISLNGTVVPTSQALSSVPLQFLIYINNVTTPCSDHLVFVDTPPDGSEYIVPNGSVWSQRVYFQGNSKPSSVSFSGPVGMGITDFQPDDFGRSSVMYADLSWTPTPAANEINIVCVKATDGAGLDSEQRCFVLLTGYPDPCASNPCQNNGQCNITFTNFTCTCPNGVYGDRCQHDIDECLKFPCTNGGQCYNFVGDYKCFCRPGFAGKNCSDSEYCSSNPCQGRGDCVHNVTSFACDCYHGYSGRICEIDEDDCSSTPCLNGAECTDLVGGYRCECPPKYTGQHCEQEIDFCEPSPCQNGGICRRQNKGYVCDCPDDVIGLNCEISIEQICNGDQSYCTCHVNGEPVRVPIPNSVDDETYERNLRAGVVSYPLGLLIGVGCCAFFHYIVRPRCKPDTRRRNRKMSTTSSASSFLSTRTRSTVYPDRISLPPSYSSVGWRAESNI